MANAYENTLATGQVVVRRFWYNTQSSRDQVSVQFAQKVERPSTGVSANSSLIALEQGSEELDNTTTVTAIRSFSAEKAREIFGATEGSFVEGGTPILGNDVYSKLGGAPTEVAIQVTENFTKNRYAKNHDPKINPASGEVVMAMNPATDTLMPVYRHTDIALAHLCENNFIAASPVEEKATAIERPAMAGELAS
tara:strand:+ start:257 stop:841 length:585 start_codon:yes stop_codon:yes gene_type:complete